ncbi:MAG: GTP 3',8-cyclase MoaA [Oscillospiraceae bacterium]|nr:GTP 3',8-cyclase MoaA [Oscillospiraceae bacterium]
MARKVDYLRLSITDLCNLRCRYCMGEDGVVKKQHREILSLEELEEMAQAAVSCGVKKIRLTGGEPLVRRGVVDLCRRLKAIDGVEELALTTNGVLLRDLAAPLRAAGVDRLNISLDSLDPAQYSRITRCGDLQQTLEGIAAAEAAGFRGIKLNAVLLRDYNAAEISEFVELTREKDYAVRFIELMPMAVCADWDQYLSAEAVLEAVPQLERIGGDGVAELYRVPGYCGTVGLIRPISHRFCADCNRIRITADGKLKPCLHSRSEIPLRGLHGGELREAILEGIAAKPERHFLQEKGVSDCRRDMNEIGG